MKKKVLSCLLALSMSAALLAGCGSSSSDSKSSDDSKKTEEKADTTKALSCLLYTSPSPRDMRRSRMPSSA